AVAEALECKVDYIDGLVIIKSGNDIINLTIGSDILTKNGENIQMDTAAVIISDRTFIPVRYIAEALGYTVNWENIN
ncbi:MAG: copper amine oxidase N-terminal domain-containing protein, partial [Clostridia bacterium]|nr:copper amine oxidase N-terminal domain-containing protein [Clostridia bacterium]